MWLTHQFSTARGKASVVGTCDINKDLHETSQDSCVCVCVRACVRACARMHTSMHMHTHSTLIKYIVSCSLFYRSEILYLIFNMSLIVCSCHSHYHGIFYIFFLFLHLDKNSVAV